MILDSASEFFKNCIENSPTVIDHSHIIWKDKWDDQTMNTISEIVFKKYCHNCKSYAYFLLFLF